MRAIAFIAARMGAPITLTLIGTDIRGDGALPAGVANGDALTFEVYADNGNPSQISQTWALSAITGALFSTGSYSATVVGGFPAIGAFGSFLTDATASLAALDIEVVQDRKDTASEGLVFFYMNGQTASGMNRAMEQTMRTLLAPMHRRHSQHDNLNELTGRTCASLGRVACGRRRSPEIPAMADLANL